MHIQFINTLQLMDWKFIIPKINFYLLKIIAVYSYTKTIYVHNRKIGDLMVENLKLIFHSLSFECKKKKITKELRRQRNGLACE